MVKKNKRIGDRESYLEQQAALLPLRFTFVPFGTGHAGSGEEAIRTLVTVMSDKHAPGMARLNAVVELSNRGYGRPPQQPIEGLTPQLPENPTEDEIVEHYVRSGLAPLFASRCAG